MIAQDNTDTLLSGLEAVKNYPQLKQERDQLVAQKKELEGQLNRKHQDNTQAEYSKAIAILQELLADYNKPHVAGKYSEPEKAELLMRVGRIIESQVVERLNEADDSQLRAVFRQEGEKQLQKLLNRWPRRLGKRNDESIQRLREKLMIHPFVALSGEIFIPCNKCIGPHRITLYSYDVRVLLTQKQISCPADSLIARLYGAHAASISLGDIIAEYLLKKS